MGEGGGAEWEIRNGWVTGGSEWKIRNGWVRGRG